MANEVQVLDPKLDQIVNVGLTKKDILEIVEVDAYKALDEQIALANAKIKALEEKDQAIRDEISKLDKEEEARILAEHSAKYEDIFGVAKEKRVSLNWDRSRCKVDHSYVRNTFGGQDLILIDKNLTTKASLRLSTNEVYDLSVNVETDKTYTKKVVKLVLDRQKMYQEQENTMLHNRISDLEHQKKLIPGQLKSFSAELTKKALSSNEAGKKVLELINKLKAKATPIALDYIPADRQ